MWRILQAVAIAGSTFFLGTAALAYRAKKRLRSDFNYAMQVLAAGTVKRARAEQKISLDYSVASVDEVERVLGEHHNRHLQRPIEEQEIVVLSRRWGAYIGEVMKRVRPGQWRRDSEKAGAGTMPLIFGDIEAFPCSWAYKRIADGPEDNIVFKFQVFSDEQLRESIGLDRAKPR